MTTKALDASQIVSELNSLIHLDYDAIHAYDAAIERLEDQASRQSLTTFRADHARHVEDLQRLVRELGGQPADRADAMRILTQGKVVIMGITGDKGVLAAMKANEEVTNKRYEKACALQGLTTDIRAVLERNLADERRHRAWIDQRLQQLGQG